MSMPEKSMFPSRLLMCLITISMFLLMVSSIFLLQSSGTSFVSTSVFKLILINNTSVYFKPKVEAQYSVPAIPSLPVCQISNVTRPAGGLEQSKHRKCETNQAQLKVFMYDMPPEFHFGLMGWSGKRNQTWPDIDAQSKIPLYPGGLNLQHSMEYWLTLDLLSSNLKGVNRSCTAIRVENSSETDVIFVPFFSSLSYNRHSKMNGAEKISVNKVLQSKLVKYLKSREEWKRFEGKDHLIIAHHPNSMVDARKKLGSAMFVLADFGRYPTEIANLEKDVIAPYKHVVKTIEGGNSTPFESRPILAYFQGAIYRKDGGAIRQELYYILKDEPDVHFKFGSVGRNGISKASQGMRSSKFCLNIAGDTPSSNRLFDAIASHCVPVVISDEIELPFEQMLDYSEFCVFVPSEDAVKKGYLLNLLRGIKRDEWTRMWERLKAIAQHFEYRYPSQPGDAVDMIWREVSIKVASMRFKLHRNNRYQKTQLLLKSD